MGSTWGWAVWAGLSAVFAAMTAILGKVGVQNVNPDFATLVRTVVILGVTGCLVAGTGGYQAAGGSAAGAAFDTKA